MSKIVFVTPSYPPQLGGVETHVSQVTAQLINKGHQVTVITGSKTDKKLCPEKVMGINTKGQAKYEIWQQIWSLRNVFFRADIVHVHDVGWWLAPVMPFVLHKFNITFHGWEGDYPVRWQAKLHRLILALFARKTVHIGHFIQLFYWDVPDLVMYGGFDEKLLDTDVHAIKQPINIVFFGRLVAENGIDLYLQLLSELKQKKLKFNMNWVGDGPYKEKCSQFGEVTGMIAQTTQYLAEADLVMANSYLSMLQAQAMGKIVVSLYDNPLKEAYLDTYPGKEALINSESPNMAADQLEEVLTSSDRSKKLQKKAQRLVGGLTWKNVTDQYLELWGVKNR